MAIGDLNPTAEQQMNTPDWTPEIVGGLRVKLGISESLIEPENTYILFKADAGNNNLHLFVGAVKNYSISKGDGTLPVNYNDNGGIKILNYTLTGHYLIRIESLFNGINTDGAVQSDKDKYIEFFAGENNPITIDDNAFKDCVNLEKISINKVVTINFDCFTGTAIKELYAPVCTFIKARAFKDCLKLDRVIAPLLTGFNVSVFENCPNISFVSHTPGFIFEERCFFGCINLRRLEVTYDAGNLFNTDAFTGVILDDFVITGATKAQALTYEASYISNGGKFSKNARLIYENGDNAGIFEIYSLNISNVPVFANNAAALVGLLVAGDLYKTSAAGDAQLMITNAV